MLSLGSREIRAYSCWKSSVRGMPAPNLLDPGRAGRPAFQPDPRCPGPCSKTAANISAGGSGPCLPSGDPRPWPPDPLLWLIRIPKGRTPNPHHVRAWGICPSPEKFPPRGEHLELPEGYPCGLRSRVGADASSTAASGPWPGPSARENPIMRAACCSKATGLGFCAADRAARDTGEPA